MTRKKEVADEGEWRLIEAIRRHLPSAPPGQIWSGDDAAVLPSWSEKLVFTTDVLVDGVDFNLDYCPPATIGAKCVAVNASDVAAMGGRPRALVAALTVPRNTLVDVVEEIAAGLAKAGKSNDIDVVGGDISEGRELSLTGAMVGSLPGPPMTRAGARPGDLICVTGSLGAAAAGLLLLRAGARRDGGLSSPLQRVIERQLVPRPRIAEGRLAASCGATAMIDVSDGLVADIVHVLDASGVGCALDPASIPIDPDVFSVDLPQGSPDALRLALGGGEDYELAFTISPDRLEDARTSLQGEGAPVAVVGEITPADRSLGDRSLEEWDLQGWEHLRRR